MTFVQDRRVRGWLCLGTAILLVLSVAACGGSDDTSSDNKSPAVSSPGNGGEPDSDATLRIARVDAPSRWDPHSHNNPQIAGGFLPLVYDQLLHIGPDLTVEPMLATSYEMSDDGLTLDLELRTDAMFQDGTPVDAAAVKANLDQAKTQENSTVANLLATVRETEVTGPSSVRVSFSEPSFTFPVLLAADSRVGSIVNPAAFTDLDRLSVSPQGSGPYTLADQSGSTTATFERRPDGHWDTSAGGPAKIVFTNVPDQTTLINGVKSGQFDVVQVTVSQSPELRDYEQPGQEFQLVSREANPMMMYLNISRDGLSDPRVRTAITKAIDRKAIADIVYNGLCTPTRQLFSPAMDGYDSSLDSEEALQPDPDAARELLDEAGVGNLKLNVIVHAGIPTIENQFQVLQQQLAPLGIDMQAISTPVVQASADFRAGKNDAVYAPIVGVADPADALRTTVLGFYSPGGAPSELEPQIRAVLDMAPGAERTAELEDIAAHLADEPVGIPLCRSVSGLFAAGNVRGLEMDTSYSWNSVGNPRYMYIVSD